MAIALKDGLIDEEWLDARTLPEVELLEDFFKGLEEASQTEAERAEAYAVTLRGEEPREKEKSVSRDIGRVLDSYGQRPDQSSIYTGLALIRDGENNDALGKLSRYETGLRNSIARTLTALSHPNRACSIAAASEWGHLIHDEVASALIDIGMAWDRRTPVRHP